MKQHKVGEGNSETKTRRGKWWLVQRLYHEKSDASGGIGRMRAQHYLLSLDVSNESSASNSDTTHTFLCAHSISSWISYFPPLMVSCMSPDASSRARATFPGVSQADSTETMFAWGGILTYQCRERRYTHGGENPTQSGTIIQRGA